MNTNAVRKFWKWSSVPLTALLLSLPGMAQNPGGQQRDPQKMVDRQVSHMRDALKLNANQEAQVRTILEDRNKKLAALWTQYPRPERGQKPSADAIAAMKAVRTDTHDQLAKVLDADQLAKFDHMNRRGHRGPRKQQ